MSKHPLIALWSHPRSMSTAMERIMRERGDLICAHEPFMYDYYAYRKVREMPYFEIEEDRPLAYPDIRDWLLAQAETAPVFFKDMSYYVVPQMLDDTAFMNRVTHTFLIRNPVASILSYHKLDPQVSSEEIGLEAQWKHYEHLKEHGTTPVVIEAEAVRNRPGDVIASYWSAVGLSYKAEAFDWNANEPEDWKQVDGWHQDVMGSQGIKSMPDDEAERKQKQFDEACKTAPHLADLLAHHQPYYEKLRAVATAG